MKALPEKAALVGQWASPIFKMDRKPRDVGTRSIAIEVGAGLFLLNESLQVWFPGHMASEYSVPRGACLLFLHCDLGSVHNHYFRDGMRERKRERKQAVFYVSV